MPDAPVTLPPSAEAAPHPMIRGAPTILPEDLAALAGGRLLALRVPGYVAPALCRRHARTILRHPALAPHGNVVAHRRIGMLQYEAMLGPLAEARYHAEAADSLALVRAVFAPFASPMDRLRVALDETWPSGATLARLGGRRMFAGTLRVFDSGQGADAHSDFLPADIGRDDPLCAAMTGQLAANVYLATPPAGGELEIWELRLDGDQYDAMEIPGGYGLRRELLPPPAVMLRPLPGELILLDSTRVHAILPAGGGPRISLSCFIGVSGADRPLAIWS